MKGKLVWYHVINFYPLGHCCLSWRSYVALALFLIKPRYVCPVTDVMKRKHFAEKGSMHQGSLDIYKGSNNEIVRSNISPTALPLWP